MKLYFTNNILTGAQLLIDQMYENSSKYYLWVSEERNSWVLGMVGEWKYIIKKSVDEDIVDFLIKSWIITAPAGGCTPDTLEEMSREEKDVQIALSTQLQMTGHYRLWYTYFPQPHEHFRTANDFSPAERTQGIAAHRLKFFEYYTLQMFGGIPLGYCWRNWVPLKYHKYLKEGDTIVPSR